MFSSVRKNSKLLVHFAFLTTNVWSINAVDIFAKFLRPKMIEREKMRQKKTFSVIQRLSWVLAGSVKAV